MDTQVKGLNRGHVLLLPYPAQGHINPILQFGKRLASKGLKITLAATVYLSKSMHLRDRSVGVEFFSDGFDETGHFGARSGEHLLSTMKKIGSQSLATLIAKYKDGNDPFTCLVCDSYLPWGLDVGKELGLVTAAFYTQACGVTSIFYHVKQGNLTVPIKGLAVSLPGLPALALQDLHSSVISLEPTEWSMAMGQFSNLERADWLLFNTFHELESEVLAMMAKLLRVRAIGPTVPSMYLDEGIEGDTENSLNMFKPSDNDDYNTWLNGKEVGSVLYISFGSMAELGQEQMEELISGIKQSNREFLWVVREAEQSKLPAGYAEQMLDKGLLVSWCSQLEVLAHDAIGCFLTHCGWNSTMEALSLGVPMVAMPQIWDQFTNAKLVEDVWKLGIRAKKDDKGIVRRQELELCIREVMEGERREEIKTNAARWRGLAIQAVDEGGSSDLNITEFVATIMCA
ncbi:4-alpha-glucanotransferase [Ranunculus cassubicifolius]